MSGGEIVAVNSRSCSGIMLQAHTHQEEPEPEEDEVDRRSTSRLELGPLVGDEDRPPGTDRKRALRVRRPSRLPVHEEHLHGALLVD